MGRSRPLLLMKNKKTSPLNSLAVLSLLLAWPAASFAQLKVEVLDTVKIHESRHYGWFPSVQMLSTGELICDFSLDGDVNTLESNFWGYTVSTDQGKTWGMRHTAGALFREGSYTRDPALPDGSMLVVAGLFVPKQGDDYQTVQTASVRLSDGGQTALFKRDVFVHLPKAAQRLKLEETTQTNFESLGGSKIKEAAFMLFSGTIVAARDGGWLTTMYGKLEGDKFFRTLVVKSDKFGKNWDYLSTIAGKRVSNEFDSVWRSAASVKPRRAAGAVLTSRVSGSSTIVSTMELAEIAAAANAGTELPQRESSPPKAGPRMKPSPKAAPINP